jgi:hypothetical protein
MGGILGFAAALVKVGKSFNDDIRMEFDRDKCIIVTFKSDQLTQTSNIYLDIDTVITEIKQKGTYICL